MTENTEQIGVITTEKVLHFHNYNHIALTVVSKNIPKTGYYVLGMSLAHKEDNGSRFIGRNYAQEALNEGLNDTDLDLHLAQMRDSIVMAVLDRSGTPNVIRGQKGHYIVFGIRNVKDIMLYLRETERYASNSKANSVYHRAFFNLPELYKKIRDHVYRC